MARAHSIYVVVWPGNWVDEVYPFTVKHEAKTWMRKFGITEGSETDARNQVLVYEDGTGKVRKKMTWTEFLKD